MKNLLWILLVLFFSSFTLQLFAQDEGYGEYEEYSPYERLEANGVGVGVEAGSFGNTGVLFFDHNIDLTRQLHIQSGSAERKISFPDKGVKGNVKRSMIFSTYRSFLSSESGLYFGYGLGAVKSQLSFTSKKVTNSSDPAVDYSATGSGVAAVLELGWQGNEGFYFNIGFQPAVYITYSDDFDEKKIPDLENYRTSMVKEWDTSKKIGNEVMVGLGLYF